MPIGSTYVSDIISQAKTAMADLSYRAANLEDQGDDASELHLKMGILSDGIKTFSNERDVQNNGVFSITTQDELKILHLMLSVGELDLYPINIFSHRTINYRASDGTTFLNLLDTPKSYPSVDLIPVVNATKTGLIFKSISSLINFLLDENLIKGGHHAYDTFIEIDGLNPTLRHTGMYSVLNSSLTGLNDIDVSPNLPGFVVVVGDELWVFSNPDTIYVYNVTNSALTNTIVVPSSFVNLRYLQNDGTYIYFMRGEADLLRINISSKAIDGTSYSFNQFCLTAIIVNQKIFVSDSSGFLRIVDIPTWGVSPISIALSPAPFSFSADPVANLVYAGASTGSVVRVIDAVGCTVVNTISMPGANNVFGNFISTINGIVPVLETTTNHIVFIRTSDNALINRQPTGTNPANYIIANGKVFIANFGSSSLTVVSLFDYSVIATIPVSAGPCGAGNLIYYKGVVFVPCFTGKTICAVNTTTLTVSFTVMTAGQTRALAFHEGQMQLYNSIQNGNHVSAFKFQPREIYILQENGNIWEKATPLTTNGGYVDKIIQYTFDNTELFKLDDSIIPDSRFIKNHLIPDALTGNPSILSINNHAANYTLVLTDNGKMIEMDSAGAITVIIPANASVAFAIGTQILFYQKNTGQITFTPSGGVTLVSADSNNKSRVQYSSTSLIKTAINTWLLIGDTTI